MSPALVPLDTQPLYDNCAESVSLTRHEGNLLALIGCPSANVDTLVSPGRDKGIDIRGGTADQSQQIAFMSSQTDRFGTVVVQRLGIQGNKRWTHSCPLVSKR